MKNQLKPVCRCAAYSFPHRKFGGKCPPRQLHEYENKKENIDALLDDPRRGQSAGINGRAY